MFKKKLILAFAASMTLMIGCSGLAMASDGVYYDDDDSSVYAPDYWTYSNEPNDRDFAGEVYELNDEGKAELNYWLRCRRFNEYQRSHAFNPRTETPEQEWALLTRNYGRRIR